MNILLEKHNMNPDHIYFGETLHNSIIENGVFTRVIYSSSDFVMNGMHFYVEIPSQHLYRENNRIKIRKENDLLNFMFYVENAILQKISLSKSKNYKLKEYLKNGFIKYNSENDAISSIKCILKISGVWETENEYGLTFKIVNIN
jgi:hypothetical protein